LRAQTYFVKSSRFIIFSSSEFHSFSVFKWTTITLHIYRDYQIHKYYSISSKLQ